MYPGPQPVGIAAFNARARASDGGKKKKKIVRDTLTHPLRGDIKVQ